MPEAIALATLVLLLALVPGGCGSGDRPTLAPVHGHVTLDGKPLARAGVAFNPIESGGRESSAVTNSEGEYVLRYIRDEMGGVLGKNAVRITTQRNSDPTTEKLPPRYNKSSTLTADVHSGDNEIDFPLTLP